MPNLPIALGTLFAIGKFLARGGLKTIVGAWMLIKRFGLHTLLFFLAFVFPEFLGSYTFLTQNGIEWYFAIPSALGVEAGGSLFTVFNNAVAIADGGTGIGTPLLIFGAISSLTTFFWYIYVWVRFVGFFGGLPPVALMAIGSLIFGLTVLITLLVDSYMLSGETLRISGMTYFIENPDQSTAPLRNLIDSVIMGGAEYNPGNNTTGGP